MSIRVQAAELAAKDAEDPLDAFMAQEILPEVKQKEQQEAARKEEERKALAQQLAVGRPPPLGSGGTTALPSDPISASSLCSTAPNVLCPTLQPALGGFQPLTGCGKALPEAHSRRVLIL